MSTLDLLAPGANAADIARGLVAAGDVIRASGMSPEIVRAGRHVVVEHYAGRLELPDQSWHWRAADIFEHAERAALAACFGSKLPPPGSQLLIVKSAGQASLLD